jgi:hypothetical protein
VVTAPICFRSSRLRTCNGRNALACSPFRRSLLAEWTYSKLALFISLIALAVSTRSMDQFPGTAGARALQLAEGFVEIAQGL